MIPLVPERQPELETTLVFIAPGRRDPLVQREETERLVARLRRAGADVALHRSASGHHLTAADVAAAKAWLAPQLQSPIAPSYHR